MPAVAEGRETAVEVTVPQEEVGKEGVLRLWWPELP